MEPNNLGKTLNMFRENQYFCDVTLLVENRRFPCHRVILAQGCSYFYAMLSNFKEKNSDEIVLEGFSSNGFEDILNFIYENKVNINKHNFKSLLVASDMLGIGDLQATCEDFMRDDDVLGDLVDLFMYYADINNAKLTKKLKRVICEKFSDICDSGFVVHLHYEGLKSILKCKFLTARKEETVFDGVFKWIKFAKESRLNYMEELLSLIKVPSLSSPYMIDFMINEPIVYNDKKYHDMVVKSEFTGLYKTCKKPKIELHEPGFMLFSRNSLDATNFTPEVFRKNKFVQNFNGLSFETQYLRSVILNKYMLFVLSRDNERKLKFQKINLNTSEIVDLKAPSSKPRYFTLQTDGSRIYLYAQSAFYNSKTKFYAYDVQQDVWVKIPDLTINGHHIGNSCFIVHQNKLYSIGGNLKDSDRINNVFSFDTRGGNWTPLTPMNQARSRPSACFVNENLCVSGGIPNSRFEVLDFSTGKWHSVSYSLPPQNSILSMYCANNNLYLIRGTNEKLRRYVRHSEINITDISKLKFEGPAIRQFNFPNKVWKSVNIEREAIVDAVLFD